MDRDDLMRLAFQFTMAEEGRDAYTNDPRDQGGPTKYGVALNFNRDVIPDKDGNGVIDANDVRLLTEDDALTIYQDKYWSAHIRSEYPTALAFMLADMVFTPGPGATPRLLQKALNDCGHPVAVDGGIGKETLDAVAIADIPTLLHALAQQRLVYYQSRKGWSTYGKGWAARTNRCLEKALGLAGDGA